MQYRFGQALCSKVRVCPLVCCCLQGSEAPPAEREERRLRLLLRDKEEEKRVVEEEALTVQRTLLEAKAARDSLIDLTSRLQQG